MQDVIEGLEKLLNEEPTWRPGDRNARSATFRTWHQRLISQLSRGKSLAPAENRAFEKVDTRRRYTANGDDHANRDAFEGDIAHTRAEIDSLISHLQSLPGRAGGGRRGFSLPVTLALISMVGAIIVALINTKAWQAWGAGGKDSPGQTAPATPTSGASGGAQVTENAADSGKKGATKSVARAETPESAMSAPKRRAAETPAPSQPAGPPKDSRLSVFKVDIFWCDNPPEAASRNEAEAFRVRTSLDDAFELQRLRVRKVPLELGASGYEIRVDPDGSEDASAMLIQRQLNSKMFRQKFQGFASSDTIPNYISVFVCEGIRIPQPNYTPRF